MADHHGPVSSGLSIPSSIISQIGGGLRLMLRDSSVVVYFSILVGLLLMAVLGPAIAPYPADERIYDEEGNLMRSEPPSGAHLLGTTNQGLDVLSRLLVGARPTMITGVLGGSIIIVLGLTIGITSGYVGGRVDGVLMRFTDMVYSIPLLPFAILVAATLNLGYFTTIIIIGLVLWRGSARVIRAQVLQIKERPFILAAEADGASRARIILKHILPNVMAMGVLFFSLGIGASILIQAGLAFLGVVDPFIPSWGLIVRNAYDSGMMAQVWWWSLPPGILISLTVISSFMFGRSYERIAGQGDDEAFTGGTV